MQSRCCWEEELIWFGGVETDRRRRKEKENWALWRPAHLFVHYLFFLIKRINDWIDTCNCLEYNDDEGKFSSWRTLDESSDIDYQRIKWGIETEQTFQTLFNRVEWQSFDNRRRTDACSSVCVSLSVAPSVDRSFHLCHHSFFFLHSIRIVHLQRNGCHSLALIWRCFCVWQSRGNEDWFRSVQLTTVLVVDRT